MPELPEVETVARSLAPLIEGRVLRRGEILDALLDGLPLRRLTERRVARVFRCGKEVLLELTRGRQPPLWLAVHLRMTGRLLWRPGDQPGELRHVRAHFALDGGYLVFQDTRRFGTLRLYQDLAAAMPQGLDPTSDALTLESLGELLARGSGGQALKPFLLRQDRLVGLGNIYASEILHHAGLAPTRPCGGLRLGERRRLLLGIKEVLAAAMEACGTTFSDFQSGSGSIGSYQEYLRVYGREGQPCARCGATVRRTVQQQRATFDCPGCQK